jgi:hypothetical protein
MKKIILMPLCICLFALTIIGCNQKNVGDISIAPDPSKLSYYVSDPLGSDLNNGLTPTTPFKTLAMAYNNVVAGDTVFIMNGNYSGGTLLNITKSGTATKNITFKNYPGQSPKLLISGNVYNGIIINGSYIVIDGLEMQGNNANLTYAGALASYNLSKGGTVDPNGGTYNTNAILIGGSGTSSQFPTHVTVRNCKIHDFPGGGLNSIQADYTTFDNNISYNNAWYMIYGGSGISILTPFNSDAGDTTVYKNFVRNNFCYGNKTQLPVLSNGNITDGNGIIIDVNQSSYSGQATANGTYYNSRTLVQNNVSFNNGGSGIHAFKASHVDIINNTAYGNGTITGYGNIFAGYVTTDVRIMNNIMYASTGGKCTTNGNNTGVTYDYNIYFNGTVAVMGAHDKLANPLFVNASTDGTQANFSLLSGSPAIDAGTKTIFAPTDILGVTRPKGAGVDCGAYEVQ